MKLNVEEPFLSEYNLGYLYMSDDGRRRVCLKHSDTNKRLTISYARYLYSVYLWKTSRTRIPDEIEVDHINNDKTDDRIENLQLLTKEQNAKKNAALMGRRIVLMQCPVCNQFFFRPHGLTGLVRPSRHTISLCCQEHKHQFARVREFLPMNLVDVIEFENKVLIAREFDDGRVVLEKILNPEKARFVLNQLNR